MNFQLTVLGSNSALPTTERFTTAHLLNASERFFLIDCGEGTQMQLRKFRIKFTKIKHIFISHLHGDHFFGLFGVLSSFDLLGRQGPLHIHAHPKLNDILQMHQEKIGKQSYPVHFHPIHPGMSGIIHEDDRVEVYTFPLKHRIATNGFLFKEKIQERNIKKEAIAKYNLGLRDIWQIKNGADFISNGQTIPNHELSLPPYKPRSYAFCSDTGYTEDIIPYIKGVDILYHEATFRKDMGGRAETTFHSTTHQAAAIARMAGVGRLVIGHFSARHKHEIEEMVHEAREVFPATYPAHDGNTYEVQRVRMKE